MKLLLISGSTRSGSSNTAVLRTVQALAPPAVSTVLYTGLARLPAFNPDDDHEPLPEAVAGLRRELAGADAVLFCTPEYAGGLPGSLKNLLDWTVGGVELTAKPVAWINASGRAAPAGGAGAHAALATVLGYVSASVVEPACLRLVLARDMVGDDGVVHDPQARAQIGTVISALAAHVAAAG